jgi:hypothetical protein
VSASWNGPKETVHVPDQGVPWWWCRPAAASQGAEPAQAADEVPPVPQVGPAPPLQTLTFRPMVTTSAMSGTASVDGRGSPPGGRRPQATDGPAGEGAQAVLEPGLRRTPSGGGAATPTPWAAHGTSSKGATSAVATTFSHPAASLPLSQAVGPGGTPPPWLCPPGALMATVSWRLPVHPFAHAVGARPADITARRPVPATDPARRPTPAPATGPLRLPPPPGGPSSVAPSARSAPGVRLPGSLRVADAAAWNLVMPPGSGTTSPFPRAEPRAATTHAAAVGRIPPRQPEPPQAAAGELVPFR